MITNDICGAVTWNKSNVTSRVDGAFEHVATSVSGNVHEHNPTEKL